MWFEASSVTGTIILSDARSPFSQGYVCGWGCFDSEGTRSFSAQTDRIAGCLTGLLGCRRGFGPIDPAQPCSFNFSFDLFSSMKALMSSAAFSAGRGVVRNVDGQARVCRQDPSQHRGGNSGVGAAANFDPAANDAARLWISFQWTVDGQTLP
jgi:hypothetical protein